MMKQQNIFRLIYGIGLVLLIIGGYGLLWFTYKYQFTQNFLPVLLSAVFMSLGMSGLIVGFMNLNNVEKDRRD